MKSIKSKIILLCTVSLFCMLIGFYFFIGQYYKNCFPVNTWINGVYCTGMTIEEVNTLLLADNDVPSIRIVDSNGIISDISLEEAEYSEDLKVSLSKYRQNQNIVLWPKHFIKEQRLDIIPVSDWDNTKLKKLILDNELVKERIRDQSTIDVNIILTDKGYELYDGMQNVFDYELFADTVIKNFKMGILSTDINDPKFYYVEQDSEQQSAERDLWLRLDAFLNTGLIYDMGAEQIVFDKKITSGFLNISETGEFILDENGNFTFSDEKILQYATELFNKYNTVNTNLVFVTTNGDMVEVPYNKYGTQIDVKTETDYLLNALHNNISETHIPKYTKEGYVRGLDDIGDTYIEVDMTLQKLYGYKDGELIVDTDVVTGNMRNNWDTPVGVNYVYAKQKKRILRGTNYATPVDYWMPVVGGVGLHDANWRNEFGGDIYLTNGSHGCINIPPDVMAVIYQEYEVGTPVIMFY